MPSRPRTPPTTIWLYLTGDLWKRIALSASILVTVIAFAAAIQPLANGQIGPLDALRFMALAVVPMLQFALPFAAGFAATLVYHDFATDNEAMACSAGGVSHRSILAPAAFTGALLAIVIYALTTTAIPRFFGRIEQLIARDIARILTTAIDRGDSVTLRDLTIHADRIDNLGPDPDSGAMDRLVLTGVVAVATDNDNRIEVDLTARRADVWLFAAERFNQPETRVVMQLTDAHGKQAGAGAVDLSQHQLGPWSIPSGVRDRIKTRTAGELRELSANPDLRPMIDQKRRELAAGLAARLYEIELADAVARDHRLTLIAPDGRIDCITRGLAPDGARWSLLPTAPGEPIEIIRHADNGEIRRQHARAASIDLTVSAQDAAPRITLHLEQVRSADAQGEAERAQVERTGLAPTIEITTPFFDQPSARLIEAADRLRADTPADDAAQRIASLAARLRNSITHMQREIVGHVHERYALAVATLLMTILGAILALKLRQSLPLTVYLWSFFPALVALITISSGSNASADNLFVGVAVIWSGVAALAIITAREFAQLRRH
ncbi:MAG: LptF/LptG family permease [Phycisphaeraceae bacterium]|nr:LptF/LptG family permease [Phycisphaeraceae bacterium]MCB9847132.1 LptF/LptG family permease [Phycisphaeraceae bacterium]